MYEKPIQPFTAAGSTPEIKKILGGPIALSPAEAIVAENGIIDGVKQSSALGRQWIEFIYLSNYETKRRVGQILLPGGLEAVSFSPDGSRLFAIAGGLLICSQPWDIPQVLHNNTLSHAMHGAWLDDRTVLVAGIHYNQLTVAMLDIEGELRVLHDGQVQAGSEPGAEKLDSVCCSRSGLIACTSGYGRHVSTYQLAEDRNSIQPEAFFDAQYNGNGLEVAVAEDGQTILCTPSSFRNAWIGLFDRQGKLMGTLNSTSDHCVYRYGAVFIRRHLGRSVFDGQIYRVKDGMFRHWCSSSIGRGGKGLDILIKNERTLVAIEEENCTTVFELLDHDVLQLSSRDAEQRNEAAQNIGRRRYSPAVPALTRLLADEFPSVQSSALQALKDISDAAALPPIIRALGDRPVDSFDDELFSVIRGFDKDDVSAAVLECIKRPEVTYRRGALRILDADVSVGAAVGGAVGALDELCRALSDPDEGVRQSAAHALGKRNDIRACIPLVGRIDDPAPAVRLEVHKALASILEAGGMLSTQISSRLSQPMDVTSYADQVIAAGRMRQFASFGDPNVGDFLKSLAHACVDSRRPLTEILSAVETLSSSAGLAVAIVCADAMRQEQRWPEAADVYRNIASLAVRFEAPQIEWRAWHAMAECLEPLADDKQALNAYGRAIDVIDRLWFLLLEEDKPRDFFREKALLYDGAELCALRLGHRALALEYREKAKTRYAGDLIARKQMNPQAAVDVELREFWRIVDGARALRAQLPGSRVARGEQLEIVGVHTDNVKAGTVVVKPERLAAFEQSCQNDEGSSAASQMVRAVWNLVVYCASLNSEVIREHLEKVYQSLLPIQEAAKAGSLPMPVAEQTECLKRYDEAAYALVELDRGRNGTRGEAAEAGESDVQVRHERQLWIFWEFRSDWLSEILNSAAPANKSAVLGVVMEALNTVLHHEPVFGVSVETSEEEDEGLVFESRSAGRASDLPARQTAVINSALDRLRQTRWRYLTRLTRGEAAGFRDISETLRGQPQTAHLQFSVTDHGTVVYVTCGFQDASRKPGLMPDLRGQDDLRVFTLPQVDVNCVRRRLTESEDSWFPRYRDRYSAGGLDAWKETIDRTSEWLYSELLAPLSDFLESNQVKSLRIIPHRALHMIPFSALYRADHGSRRRYLIDDYDIEYAPSATLQQICRERAQGRVSSRSVTALFNPTGDLPFAAAEVERVAEQFPAPDIEVLRGAEASLQKMMRSATGSVVHFSGHGLYDWNDPLESHLSLAEKDRLPLADLFSEKVALPNTTLAVLSSCETGMANVEDATEEYLGLASGFLFAGTPSVVSTFWGVNDISTSFLMTRFYQKYVADHLPPHQALRAAQVWLRDEVDRPFVIQQIRSLMDNLERQRSTIPQSGEIEDAFDKQARRLEARCQALLDEEKGNPGGRPFAHPYYWAAFMVSGAYIDAAA